MTTGETSQLCRFAATLSTEVPGAMSELVLKCLLDLIGLAAFAASRAESSESARAFVDIGIGDGPGTVLGEARTYAYTYAAFLNATYAHSLDFDDTNAAAILHPGAPVIPAALAQAERLGASGTELLDAVAIGYETCCRIGMALSKAVYDRGFHNTSVAGIFGAVAAAGRLAAIDEATMAAAFGLALSRASGSMQYLANGAWNKRFHPGFAAHDALIVLAMAQRGAIGASEAIEGRYGLLHSYTDSAEPEHITDRLGKHWFAAETAIKPYPSCRLTHGAIDAVLAIRDQIPETARHRARLELAISPTAVQITGTSDENRIVPRNIVDGQFSIYFQAAVALLEGKVSWSSYDRIGAPEIEVLTRQMTIRSIDTLPHGAGCDLTARWDKGEARMVVGEPKGEASRPIGWDDVVTKFLGLATPVYGEEKARRIVEAVADLPHQVDIRPTIALLRL